MSGGGYGYLYDSRATLIESSRSTGQMGYLDEMLQRLDELGWADAAAATRSVLDSLAVVDWLVRSIAPVWHAVEWWDDMDIGEEAARQAYDEWRRGMYPPGMVPRE